MTDQLTEQQNPTKFTQEWYDEKTRDVFVGSQKELGVVSIPSQTAVLFDSSDRSKQIASHINRDTSLPLTKFSYEPSEEIHDAKYNGIYNCGVVTINVGKFTLIVHGYFEPSLEVNFPTLIVTTPQL